MSFKESSDWYNVFYDRFFIFLSASRLFNRLPHPHTCRTPLGFSSCDTVMTWAVQINYWKFPNPCATLSKFEFFKKFCRWFSKKCLFPMKDLFFHFFRHKFLKIVIFCFYLYSFRRVPWSIRVSALSPKLRDNLFTYLTPVDPMMTSSLWNFADDHFEPWRIRKYS